MNQDLALCFCQDCLDLWLVLGLMGGVDLPQNFYHLCLCQLVYLHYSLLSSFSKTVRGF